MAFGDASIIGPARDAVLAEKTGEQGELRAEITVFIMLSLMAAQITSSVLAALQSSQHARMLLRCAPCQPERFDPSDESDRQQQGLDALAGAQRQRTKPAISQFLSFRTAFEHPANGH